MSTDIKMTKQRALSIANLSNDLVSELKQYADKTEGDLPEWLQAKIEQAYQLILSAYGTLQADEELEKALGHKYKKRVPYTNSKGKKAWKYFYDVANSLRGKTAFDDAHLVEGAKFQVVSAKGKEVHAHITKVVGDMVTYVLDDGADKGKVITKTKSAILKDMDKEHKIVDILQQKVKEKRADVKQAKQTGTAKQIQRLQEQADRLQTAINKLRGANNLAREELVKDIVEGKAPSRLPQATQEEFSKLKDMFNKLEKMEDTKTPTGRIKNFKQVKELREQIVEQVNLLGRPPHSNDRIDTALGARSANSASLGRILLSTVPSTKQSLIDFNHAERRAFFKELKKIYERHTNSSEENNFETMPEVEGYTPTSQEQFKQDRKDLEDKKETLNIFKREYEGDSNRFGDGGRLTEEQYNQLKSKLEKEITDLEIKTNEAGFNLPSSIEELEDRMKSAFPQISNVGQWKDSVSIHIEFNSSEEAKEFKKVIRSYNDGGYIGDNDKILYGLFPSRLIEVLRGYENKVKFEAKDQENNFETMPEVEPVDNFETMPEVEVQPSSFLSDEELDKKSIEELETLKSQESKRGDALTKLIYKEHDERTANLPEYKELEKVQAELKEIFRKMEEAEEANNEFDLTLLESEEDEKQEEASVLRGKISKLRDDLYKELAKKYKRDESDKYYDKLADLLSKKIKEKNESGEAEKQAKKKAERQAKQNAKREAENEAKRRNEENENKTFMLGQYNEEIDFSAFTKEQFDATKQQQESMLKQAKYDYENLKAKAKRSEFAVKAKLDQIVGRYASMIRRYELNLKRLNNFEQKNNFETMPEAKEKPLNETFKAGRKEASFFDIVKDNALYSAVQKGRFSQYFDRHLVDTGKEIEEALANSQPNEREKGLAKQRLLNAMNLDIHASKVQPSNLLVRLINGGYISKTDTREKITAKLNKLITEQRAIKELASPAQDAVRRAEREEQDRQNERKEKLAFEPERKEEIIKKANRRLSNEMKGKLARRLERGGLTDEEKDKLVKFASMVEHKQLNKLISFLKSPKTNVAKSYGDFIELTKKADEKISTYNRNSRKNGGLVSLSIEEEEIAYNSRKNGLTTEKGWAIELPVERNDLKLITNDEENSLKLVVNGDKTQYGAGLTLFNSPNIPINLLRTRDGQRLLKQISEIPSFKTEEEFKKVQSTIKEKIDEIKNDLEWLQNKHPLSKSYAVRNVAFLWNQELTKNFSEQYEKEVKLAGLDTPEGARQFLIAEGELVEPFSDSPESKIEIPELDPRLTYYLDNLESIIEKNKREKKFAFGQLEGYMKLNGFLVSALENLKDGSPFKEELAKLREDFKTSLKEKDYTSSEIARNVQRIRMLLRREQLPIDLQDDSENFETMPDEVEQENNFETMPDEVEQENNFETMPEVETQPTQELTKKEQEKKKILQELMSTFRYMIDSDFKKVGNKQEIGADGFENSPIGSLKRTVDLSNQTQEFFADIGTFMSYLPFSKKRNQYFGMGKRALNGKAEGIGKFLIHDLNIKNIKQAREAESQIRDYIKNELKNVIPSMINQMKEKAQKKVETIVDLNTETIDYNLEEYDRLTKLIVKDPTMASLLAKDPALKTELDKLQAEFKENRKALKEEYTRVKKQQESYTDADYVKAILDNRNTKVLFSYTPKGTPHEKQVGIYVNEAIKEMLDKYTNQEQENNFETMPEVEAQPTQELPENKTKAHQFASLRKKDLQERLGKLSVAELIRMAKDNSQNKIDFKEKVELTPRVKRLQKELEEAKRQFQRAKDNNYGANDEKAMVQRKTDELIDARERAYKSAGDFAGLGVAINKELAKRAGGDKDKLSQYMEEIAGVNNAVEAQPTQDQAKTKTNLYVGRERLDRLLSETETSGENSKSSPRLAIPSIYDFKESVSTVEGRGKGAEIWYSGQLYNEMLKIINRRDSSGLRDIIEEFKDANAILAKQAIATLDTDMIPVLRDAGTPTGSKSKEAIAEYNQFKTEYLEKIESANETNVPSDVQVIEYLRDKTLARLQGSLKQQAQDFLNAQIEKRKADSKLARKTAREELEESALTTPEGLTEKQVKAYRDQANLNESQIKEAGSKMEIQENENIHEPQGKLKSADSLSKKQKAVFDKIIDKKGYRQVTRQINITNTGLMYSTNGRTIVMTNLEEFEPSGDQTMTEDFLRNTVGYDNERKEKMVTLNAKTVKSLNGKIKSLTKGKEAKKKYKVIEFEPNENTGKLDMLLSSEEGEAEPILLASIENESTSLYGQAIEVKDFQRLLNLGEDITISQKTREAQDPAYAPLHFGTDALEGYIMPLKLYNR